MQEELYQTAARTFEDLAFLFPASPDETAGDEAPMAHAVSVTFRGPLRGQLEVRVGATVLPVLAANMLGQDNAPTLAQQRDALGELANVICGNVLPAIAGSREIFRLEAPRAIEPHAPAVEPAARVSLPLDAGGAEVLLFLDQT